MKATKLLHTEDKFEQESQLSRIPILWLHVLCLLYDRYFLFSNFPQDCIYDPLKSDNQIVYLLSKLSILQIMSSLHKK